MARPWVIFLEDSTGETDCYVSNERSTRTGKLLRAQHPENALTFKTAAAARAFATANATNITLTRGETMERNNLEFWKVGQR